MLLAGGAESAARAHAACSCCTRVRKVCAERRRPSGPALSGPCQDPVRTLPGPWLAGSERGVGMGEPSPRSRPARMRRTHACMCVSPLACVQAATQAKCSLESQLSEAQARGEAQQAYSEQMQGVVGAAAAAAAAVLLTLCTSFLCSSAGCTEA